MKNACGRLRRLTRIESCQVVFRLSHNSVEITSRQRRAFSRAAPMEPSTAAELLRSQASRSSTSALPTVPSASVPMADSSDAQMNDSDAHGSSSSSPRWTSRMRLVSSARST